MYNNEQWKSDGDCNICRRRTYCNKDCSAHRRGINRIISNAFVNSVAGKMLTAVTPVANYTNNYFKEENHKEE